MQVAERLGSSKVTISREVSRNSGGRSDCPSQAQGKATERRKAASAASRKLTDTVWAPVVSELR